MTACDIRRADSRGRLSAGWLEARFSFDFGAYQAPGRQGFGALRVLNEDWVQPQTGFPMHPHEDLEILMIPLEGAIAHEDSLGNRAIVHPGEVIYMGAGAGILHSQMNPLPEEVDRHLQIWILPRRRGTPPRLRIRRFDPAGRIGRWQLIASGTGCNDSLGIDQDVAIWRAQLPATGASLAAPTRPGRSLYLHVIDGHVALNPSDAAAPPPLRSGDAAAWAQAAPFSLCAAAPSHAEVLLLDLPAVNP